MIPTKSSWKRVRDENRRQAREAAEENPKALAIKRIKDASLEDLRYAIIDYLEAYT